VEWGGKVGIKLDCLIVVGDGAVEIADGGVGAAASKVPGRKIVPLQAPGRDRAGASGNRNIALRSQARLPLIARSRTIEGREGNEQDRGLRQAPS